MKKLSFIGIIGALLILGACNTVQENQELFSSSILTTDQGTGEQLLENATFQPASTNALNEARENPVRFGQDAPYVVFKSIDVGEVTLEFHNPAAGLAFFEVRIDGETTGENPHPIVNTETNHLATDLPGLIDDVIHPGVSVLSGEVVARTFQADTTVDIRLALGGERDWDFDWTTFYVPTRAEARDSCKDSGWVDLGFRNQGQCIQYYNTGK